MKNADWACSTTGFCFFFFFLRCPEDRDEVACRLGAALRRWLARHAWGLAGKPVRGSQLAA